MLLKTRFFPENGRFFEDIMALCEDKISFLSNKQAIFLAVSKFCVEVVSQNFAVFL